MLLRLCLSNLLLLTVSVSSFTLNFPSLNVLKTISTSSYQYSIIDDEPSVLPLSEFRAGKTSSDLIASQVSKSSSYNATPSKRLKSTASGVGAGLIVGLFLSGLEFGSGSPPTSGLYIGLISGTLIGLNNLLGLRVYVMSPSEAKNRLIQDYGSGVLSGLVLRSDVDDKKGDRCMTCKDGERIIGCVDFVIRSPRGSKLSREHVHLKNMIVDESYRRRGVGRKLIEEVEKYTRKRFGTTLLSLEVDDDNDKAIGLYRKSGFGEPESIGGLGSKSKYGVFVVGRSVMMKSI
ncbi:hypothetical protein TrST_g6585 [Triparma strigata]|uniref:N-acetyltransferase domain-containing protein n=1 Tax=Triparma strigata TaxID=1606541 RepID=A0A9W6ZHU2_9STRA|nr:hypothetical protein TrST_g6585 [Triparma strigata]